MIFFTNLRTAVLTLAALFIFILFTSTVSHQPHPTVSGIRSHLKNFNNAVTTASMPQGKNAFAVFLSQPNEAIVAKEEDFYFMGIRMLLYQLLHNPETRTQIQAEFVVMVTAEVSDWKRKMLRSEGAIVKEVDEVTIPWIKPGNVRWAHVMDKLHVFELVEYDKILLLDTDIVVLKNLDGVFSDPAGSIRRNLQNTSHIANDEAPQPAEYIMAGNCGPGPEHGWPGIRGDRLNAGFVLLKPSKEMFDHYISVASIEGRFPGGSPEQDLWNYVHSRGKNMPWQQLDVSWTVNSPTWRDVWHGVASVHEKYWRCKHCDVRLRDTLRRSRFKMQGYFEAREELRASLVSQNS